MTWQSLSRHRHSKIQGYPHRILLMKLKSNSGFTFGGQPWPRFEKDSVSSSDFLLTGRTNFPSSDSSEPNVIWLQNWMQKGLWQENRGEIACRKSGKGRIVVSTFLRQFKWSNSTKRNCMELWDSRTLSTWTFLWENCRYGNNKSDLSGSNGQNKWEWEWFLLISISSEGY
jgi:hypothetical protein